MPARPQVLRVSAYVVLVDTGKILLCRLSAMTGVGLEGTWTLPGGGIEFGEHPEQAAIREVREETGLDVELLGLACIDNHVFTSPEREMQALRIIYRGRIKGGTMRDEIGGTTDRCAWVTLKESWQMSVGAIARLGMEIAFDL